MFSDNIGDPQIWQVTPDLLDNLSISSIPVLHSFRSIVVGFKTNIADTIKFIAYGYLGNASFPPIDTNTRIYLYDSICHKLIDLRATPVYKFYSLAVNNTTRFRIYFAGETTYSGGVLNWGNPDTLIALKVLDGNMNISNQNLKVFNVNIEPILFVPPDRVIP